MVTELARRGNHVIYANSRYRGNDSALIMEKVVLDLAAAIRHARERLGYERIVLGGWSGGGALSLFYQQQAVKPSVARDARGRPARTSLDRGADPRRRDPAARRPPEPPPGAVRLHRPVDPRRGRPRHGATRSSTCTTPANPNQPPYCAGLPRALPRGAAGTRAPHHRRGQGAARTRCGQQGRPNDEHAFVVHGTLADPRVLDPAIDPNEREPGVSFLGDPRVVNNGPIGLARFCSLRSWLSQWSIDDANADGVRAAADVTVPGARRLPTAPTTSARRATPRPLYEALASEDKSELRIDGANHYYIGPDQRAHLGRSATACTELAARARASRRRRRSPSTMTPGRVARRPVRGDHAPATSTPSPSSTTPTCASGPTPRGARSTARAASRVLRSFLARAAAARYEVLERRHWEGGAMQRHVLHVARRRARPRDRRVHRVRASPTGASAASGSTSTAARWRRSAGEPAPSADRAGQSR